jgi:hypothetical protein
MKGMQDEFAEVRSNSTFFCGVLLQNAGIAAHPFYPKTLELLGKLIDDNSIPNIADNTCEFSSKFRGSFVEIT